jgi:hypothetical protein
MNGQLQLFAEPKPPPKPKGGSTGYGALGLLKRLQQQGLEPDALEPAARLVQLLDSEAAGRPAAGDGFGEGG